ncbi:hypothetical protein [Desertibaculum subflavum]|uniref:hypothetical protein n=1 Tax=Desertibaculum subflavum TaxID=2268458 RepID=UPI000E672DE1
MLSSFRLTAIAKTVFRSLTEFCLPLDAAQPVPVPVRAASRRRAATESRHAAAFHSPTPRLIVYWPSRRTRPLARALAIACALLATDRLPIVKPKVPAR